MANPREALFALGVLLQVALVGVMAGCCNNNFWCDGDPSFHRKPEVEKVEYDVATDSQKTEVIVSWDEKYLDLAKCVDYFYVEYARLPPDAAIEFGPQDRSNISDKPSNGVTTNLAYSVVSVRLERKKLLDEWEDSIRPLVTRYVAKVKVEPEANYTFRAVAVDKGAGWGDFEGRAVIFSEPVTFRWAVDPDGAQQEPPQGRPTEKPSDPEAEVRSRINQKYPPETCRKFLLCKEFVYEWAQEVAEHAILRSLQYRDPEPLKSIDLRNKESRRFYEGGQMHNLKKMDYSVLNVEMDRAGANWEVNITLQVRLLKISYTWNSFFSQGLLSAYHTCGQNLPLAIFKGNNENDVEEAIDKGCRFVVNVGVRVPLDPVLPFGSNMYTLMTGLKLVNFDRHSFKYDVSWFTEKFHDLELLWANQKVLVQKKLWRIVQGAFTDAIQQVPADEWIKQKFLKLDEQIQMASLEAKDRTTSGSSVQDEIRHASADPDAPSGASGEAKGPPPPGPEPEGNLFQGKR